MAVTNDKSTQETNRLATPPVKAPGREYGGTVKMARVSFTQGAAAGDANSLLDLVTLPPGKLVVLKSMSKLVCSAFGAARTMDIGNTAYTKGDGTAGAAAQDCLLDGADVSAAATLILGAGTNALGADSTLDYDSRSGVLIQGKVLGDTIPAGATVKGFIAYTND